MQSAITLKATVQSGGKIEISDAQLFPGNVVDVIVLFRQTGTVGGESIDDVLADCPGHIAFKSAEEVDAHIRQERDAWEH